MQTNRLSTELSVALAAVGWAISAIAFPHIDPGLQVPLHWGLNGVPTRFGSPLQATLLLPGVMTLLVVVHALISHTESGRRALDTNPAAARAALIAPQSVILAAHLSIMFQAASGASSAEPGGPVLYVVCLALIWIGNAVAKTEQNPFFGVKTFSTLADKAAWGAANRLGGWLLVLTGIGGIITLIWASRELAIQLIIAGAVAAALVASLAGFLKKRAG